MKKVLDFLERHVQWLAIGLGAAFVLAMAWYYVIQAPATIKVGSETLGPGDIDKYIYDNPAQAIDAQMHNPGPVTIAKPDWLVQFKCAMELCLAKPVLFVHAWVDSPVLPPSSMGGPRDLQNERVLAEKLPDVPVAVMGSATMGASNVSVPGATPGAVGVDKNWVAVAYQLSNKDLAASFGNAKLRAGLYPTAVLEVKLYRQQQKPDGSWAAPTLINRLPFPEMMPAPDDGVSVEKQRTFLNWAIANQRPIVQPPFYDWISGDTFKIPPMLPAKLATPVVIAPEGLPNFDPTRWDYSGEEWKAMTPDQRKQAQAALKKHEEDERQKQKNKNKGGRGGKGGRAPEDPDEPADDPTDIVPNPYNPADIIPSDVSTVALYWQQPAPGDQSGAPATQPAGNSCPTTAYDPSNSPDNWLGYAIDDTVEPGKIYQYKVVYSIKNPLWNSAKDCKNPALARVLEISSDVATTKWSPNVKVPARTSFYVSRNFTSSAVSIAFEVFAYKGGAKKKRVFEVAVGDMIGAPADDTDFASGSTLVDIKSDIRTGKMYVLVADATGVVSRRDFDSDKANPDYDADKRAVASGGAVVAPTGGGSIANGK